MPTGYTLGIIDGTITTFKQFATSCVRAFGATIHMRDEPMDKKYVKREPSDYHIKALEKANKELDKLNKLSDYKIMEQRKKELVDGKPYHWEAINKIKENQKKLSALLAEAYSYTPPTPDHEGIRSFMIEQLQTTMKFDGDTSYHEEKLSSIDHEIENMKAEDVRASLVEKINEDIAYHTKEYQEELKRCEVSNKWMEDFMKSI